jgi:hypothetical protein
MEMNMDPRNEMPLQPLSDAILDVARQYGYMPEGEMPPAAEPELFEKETVDFVCRAVGKEMRTTGIGEEEAVGIFTFVFLRAFDHVYQRRENPDGNVENDLSGKNLLRNDRLLSLPPELIVRLRDLPAPRIVYSAMMRWMDENRWRLDRAKVDALAPLALSLSLMYRVGVSIAFKVFSQKE